MAGVFDTYLSILNPEIDWFLRLTVNNYAVKAGVLKFSRPESTNLLFDNTASQRRFFPDTVPVITGDCNSSQRAQGKD